MAVGRPAQQAPHVRDVDTHELPPTTPPTHPPAHTQTSLVEAATSQMVFGFGMFFGGLAQFTAGILAYQRKNTFAMAAFCSYGAFWMSLSLWGILVTAKVFTPVEEGDQMMLALWGIITFLFWLCTFSMNLITSALFFSLAILFWLLVRARRAGGAKGSGFGTHTHRAHLPTPPAPPPPSNQAAGVGNTGLTKAAGGWGFLVAFLAFYDGTAQLMQECYGRDILPLFPFKPINKLQLGNFGTKKHADLAHDLESK